MGKHWPNFNRFGHICSQLSADLAMLTTLLKETWTEKISPGNVCIDGLIACVAFLFLFINIQYLAIDETIFAFLGKCPTRRTLPRKPGSHNTGLLVYFIGGEFETSSLPFVLNLSSVIPGKFNLFFSIRNRFLYPIDFFFRSPTNTERSRQRVDFYAKYPAETAFDTRRRFRKPRIGKILFG